MSVEQLVNIARETGNGAKVAFDFAFKIFNSSDLEVSKIVNSTGVATLLTLGVDYSVSFVTADEEGTVTYTVAPTALEDSFIKRVLPQDQQSALPIEGGMPETTVENMIDKNLLLIQELQEQVDRSITLAETSETTGIILPEPSSNEFLGWNAAGDQLENKTLSDAGTLEKASQADAEAGTDNDDYMTSLRTFQGITSKLTAPGPIGGTTPNTGAFTTLSATTFSGTFTGRNLDLDVADGDNVVGFDLKNLDVTNNPTTAQIENDGMGYGLKIQQDGILAAGKNALFVTSNVVHGSADTALVKILQNNGSASEPALEIINSGSGGAIEIDNDLAAAIGMIITSSISQNGDCVGIRFNLANAGAGDPIAFDFDGSEIVAAAVGGSQNRKVRCNVGGTDYFIPLHTA